MSISIQRPSPRALLAAGALLCAACALPNPAWRVTMSPDRLGEGMSYDARAGELTMLFPALDVPANLGYADGGVTTSARTTVPFDGWFHGYTIEVVDSAGAVLSRSLLHHMNIFAPNRRELFEPIMMHLVASGMETEPVRVPRTIGYPLRHGEPLLLVGMLHNPTPAALHAVRVRARLIVSRASTRNRRVAVYPFHLQVTQPGEPAEFDVADGYSVQQREARPAISGRIYGLGGHLHQYGESLTLEDVTAGKVLWSVRAVTDADGNIERVPTKRFLRGVRIHAGHVYRITSVYRNTSGRHLRNGGMGAIGGLFVPAARAAWPGVDVNEPTYRKDFAMRFGPAAAEHHVHGGR